MIYMPTVNFLYPFLEQFEITAAIQRESESGIKLTGTPKLILGWAMLLSVFYIMQKLKKSKTNSHDWCKTCNTKQFTFYQTKRPIVCIENYNLFFYSISYVGSHYKILVPKYLKNIIGGDVHYYYNGIENAPVFKKKRKITTRIFRYITKSPVSKP